MGNGLVKSRPGTQSQIRETVFRVIFMGQCKFEKDSLLSLFFFFFEATAK